MYTLKCYNKFATIERKFKKTEFLKMKRYAEKICKEHGMKFEYELES